MSKNVDYLPDYIKLLPKNTFKGYEIVIDPIQKCPKTCGNGASAFIMRAKNKMGDDKAIKILRLEKGSQEDAVSKFKDEIQKLKNLKHPNIISVEDFGAISINDSGTNQKLPYYVMEYIDGDEIDRWAEKQEKNGIFLSVKEVCSLMRQILEALKYVHSQTPPIFHLDLKPSNVLVSKKMIPKVGDFGLSLARNPDATATLKSLDGRIVSSMHPDFRKLFIGKTIRLEHLQPKFDLFGLGFTLAKISQYLSCAMDEMHKYIFYSILLKLTVADHSAIDLPKKEIFKRVGNNGNEFEFGPEYEQCTEIYEALEKLENPLYHIVKVPELQMENSTTSISATPPIRLAGKTHVPTSTRLREIIDTPIFQRLGWMKQLDQVSSVYPGAEHTRKEHSLGVYYYTARYLSRLLKEPYFVFHYSDEELRATLLAGLLHDICHYPMAHSIDESQALSGAKSHEDLAKALLCNESQIIVDKDDQHKLISIIANKWEVSPKTVAEIAFSPILSTIENATKNEDIKQNYHARKHNLLHSIISGPLDVDKMHYLMCDSIHSGNPVGTNFDAEQLIDSLSFTNKFDNLAITEKGIAAVESFLYARYRMHIDVYWHHTVRGARKMIARAIDRYIYQTKKAQKDRLNKVKEAATLLTDRDFLEWLLDTFGAETESGNILHHLLRKKRNFNGTSITVVRPIRNLYKRIRTYDPEDGPPICKKIFFRLNQVSNQQDDILKYENKIASKLSILVGTKVYHWEIIIDIPPNAEGKMEPIFVNSQKKDSQGESQRDIRHISSVADRIYEDFTGRGSKRIRIYCSPRVKKLISSNDINNKINITVFEAIEK